MNRAALLTGLLLLSAAPALNWTRLPRGRPGGKFGRNLELFTRAKLR